MVIRALGIGVVLAAVSAAHAADPQRGMQLFSTSPVRNELACIDCHSDNPQINNFGNIWVGRNAVALIQRAIASNTGGMGYFASYYNAADLADIAAWLGNAPAALAFPLTAPGSTSASQRITVSSSTKVDLSGLTMAVEGEFVIVANACAALVPRLSGCAVDLAFRPAGAEGDTTRRGALVLRHDGTPTPIRLPLQGQVQLKPPAVASLLPSALDVGSTSVGLPSAARHVRLANGSSSDLVLGALSVSNPAFVISGGSCHAGLVLGAGRSCLLSVRLLPANPGAQRGELIVQHDGVGSRSLVTLAGSAEASPAGRLEAEVAELDFGVATAGVRASGPLVTISNRGNRAALLRAPTTTDASFTIERSTCTAGLSLLPAQRCQIALAWTPGRDGAASAELQLGAEGAETLRLPLSGLAAAAALRAVPSRLGFEAPLSGSQQRTLRLVNRGSVPLRLAALTLAGPEAVEFALGSGCAAGQTIAAGSSCALPLSFTPHAPGDRSARLQVTAEGLATPLLVELSGQARPPRARVDAAALRFADRSLNDGSAAQALTLSLHRAPGAAAPLLRLVGDGAADFVPDNGCATAMPASGRCAITLRFVPLAAGLRSASLWLGGAHGDTLALVSLEGRALAAAATLLPASPEASGSLVWTGSPATFADAQAGDASTTALLTLVNRGATSSAPLVWAIGGAQGAEFSIDATSSCASAPLAPAASCSLRLQFHPASAGERRAWLRSTSEPALPGIELVARGVAPARGELLATPARVVFQARVGATSEPQRVQIINPGAAEVDLTSIELQGSGFTLARLGPQACSTAILMPGEHCTLELAWAGTAAAAGGATLALTAGDAFASAQVAVAVSEDPAQRSNVGTGGGALNGPWLIALLFACCALRAARTQSRHA